MQNVKLNFTDFWNEFDRHDNYFLDLLSPYYDIEITDNPDFLIYSCYDQSGRLPWRRNSRKSAASKYKEYRCIRIFYTPENVRPNFNQCDYAFTFDYSKHPNNYRFPLYGRSAPTKGVPFVGVGDEHPLIKREDFKPESILKEKTKFCNFVFSNRHAKKRDAFFYKLSKYKRVDSGGKHLNNIGSPVKDKLSFIHAYKFTIAFENDSYPGYTTEKILHPMLVHSLPIYWGNPLVHKDFNTKSFLNYHDYDSEDALIERIVEIDNNDDLYLEYLRQPYFHGNEINSFIDPKNLLKRFEYIFNSDKTPVACEKKGLFFLSWPRRILS